MNFEVVRKIIKKDFFWKIANCIYFFKIFGNKSFFKNKGIKCQ